MRFGLLDLKQKSDSFVFEYRLDVDASGKVIFTEEPKNNSDSKKRL
ncbi:hypothetical protein [Lacinutrix algicola]|nr:hypothetical protein [Lacinutrix algicola]